MGLTVSFVDLLKLHVRLDAIFACHQEALLCSDIERASELLGSYEAKLLPHMRDEEELLLPVYQARAGIVPGGPVELFLGEHRKMRAFLAEFHERLRGMRADQGSRLRRSIIALLDRQFMYKHLVEHHDLREKNILYPWLDRITTEEERSSLIKQCRGLEEMEKREQALVANH